MTAPDSALVLAFQAGDRDAGAALLQRHRQAVMVYLLARCRDSDLAEELTQQVIGRVSLDAGRLDPDGNLAGYLVRAARNAWRDWLRHELVRRRADGRMDQPATAPAADQETLARELQDGIRRAVAALPRAQREVVELRHQQDLTFQQIADRLHRPLGTVLSQMHAALQKMHDAMEAYR